MNLLLLLSALFFALSGLGGSARAPVAVQAVAEVAAARPAAGVAACIAAARPAAALPSRTRAALAPLAEALRLAVAVPAWKTRRRE